MTYTNPSITSVSVVSQYTCSAPASRIWRGGPPLLPSPAAPLPFLSCPASYFNSKHKTLHSGENFMTIGPNLKKVINV